MEFLFDFYVWLLHKLERCCYCHVRKATWAYMPGWEISCDKCVPRGCSCNREPVDGNMDNLDKSNWKEVVDEQGRLYPCCEWTIITQKTKKTGSRSNEF